MIFAHLNEDEKTAHLISIPRDLYFNGRKLNSYPYLYGMNQFSDTLEEITGYKVDKYVVIDMYAFIDVIDLIGGIDVHLDEALVDPTYKTFDNGVWSTLSYTPGDYHFNGRQTLRIARSRHTSSDFSRAQRQQKIIEAIQLKAKNLGFGDATTIYNILKTVLSKTETNISVTEAVRYYFKYQNFKIASNNVISSGNILYVPPYTTKEQCATLITEAENAGTEKPDCQNALDAYTLLPKDNNWNLIKWYFRQNFDGPGLDYGVLFRCGIG
ncbi:MAG TPA: LCP family protein [Candidatus Gracilibacteria bacterium]|nr:LCP family protein [Candidatus Gracilibacteria bacterium]